MINRNNDGLWNPDLENIVDLILKYKGQGWWVSNPQLKYLQIRIDVRDGTYNIFDRDSNIIHPDRVRETITRHIQNANN